MSNLTQIMERIDYWACFFLDSKYHTFYNDTHKYTYRCKQPGSYLSTNYNGHLFFIILTSITLFISAFGTVSNLLNIILLRKAMTKCMSFRESLSILAGIEFVNCFFSLIYTILTLCILENYDRSKVTLEFFMMSNLIMQTGRTASFYHSILVTFERYLLVVAPFKSRIWLRRSPLRSFIGLVIVLSLAVFLNFPWLVKRIVGENYVQTWSTNSTLKNYPYLIKRSQYSTIWGRSLQDILLLLKSVAPFPVLLLLNGLVYHAIFSWNKQRATLTRAHKQDINSAKMFSVIVFILLTCNIAPCIVYITQREQMSIYRELTMLQYLSEVSGASAYFFVQYRFRPTFKNEFWKLLGKLGELKINGKRESNEISSSVTDNKLFHNVNYCHRQSSAIFLDKVEVVCVNTLL
ncbi:unnamed protein product [Orchesella dallaii]|uniref:G-protein coupled receptors family 1 profile domain-containing protein n=1 Tax=Orchesella dallaii TaxID=48710 RepID=A0ABP1RQA9_9HEXA